MKAKTNVKNWFKAGLKVLGSFLCLYWLFGQIEWQAILDVVSNMNRWMLIPAFLFLSLSHILSVKRLEFHFRAEAIQIGFIRNLRLYFQGMFYSLFLPGIIGGDGYKMYWLKQYKSTSLSSSFRSLLIDRCNGLLALLFLAALFLCFIPVEFLGKTPLLVAFILGVYPLGYLILNTFFRQYLPTFLPSSLLSLLIQSCLLICIFFLLWGMGEQAAFLSYGLIFLMGALASVIPLSIGGLGFRELVFFYGSAFLGLDSEQAVSLSLLFYGLTLILSLFGIVELWKKEPMPN